MKRSIDTSHGREGKEDSSEPPQKKPSIDDGLTSMDDELASTDDATTYLKKVKDTIFEDKKKEYDELMKAIKNVKVDTTGVALTNVFVDLGDLDSGFNNFILNEFDVRLPFEDEQPQEDLPKFPKVLNFVGKVRSRFERNDDMFMSFVDVLKLYYRKIKSFTDAYVEIVSLLKDHKDLLDEFIGFFNLSQTLEC